MISILCICCLSFFSSVLCKEAGMDAERGLGFALAISRHGFLEPNCTPAAVDQFPRIFVIPQYYRIRGAVFIHFIISLYMLLALHFVCDYYFVPSLECISEQLNVPSHVAGATFMAAGSSAPELASTLIGVFITHDDIGTSGIIGSAVFNLFFVVGFCGVFAGREISLNPWPLLRDSFWYSLSITALLFTLLDSRVFWYDPTTLLLLYVMYIMCLFLDSTLERNIYDNLRRCCGQSRSNTVGSLDSLLSVDSSGGAADRRSQIFSESEISRSQSGNERMPLLSSGSMRNKSWGSAVFNAISFPIKVVLMFTIPNCRTLGKFLWPVTFVMSWFWIAAFTYVLIWMLTIIGVTFFIPDTVLGLTLLAAGTSLPDLLSSFRVAKSGFGDMAISNAIGSNVFDIFVGLGLPWFIQLLMVDFGGSLVVYSRGLMFSTVTLLTSIFVFILCTHWNGWRLTKRYGLFLLFWYGIFLVIALMAEFGFMTPGLPPCPSKYN